MKKNLKRLPIKAAKSIGQEYDQSQVILITYDKNTGLTHVVTWGKSIEDCALAAISGNNLKRHMGWPEEKCNDVPRRLIK